MTATTRAPRTYIVECFAPGIRQASLPQIGRQAEAAATGLRAAGQPVEYLGATLLPEDEVVFLHFRAASTEAVQAASANLPIACERIVEAVAVGPDEDGGAGRDST